MDIWWTVLFAIVMDESTLNRFQRLAIIFGRDHVCVYFGLLGTNTEFTPLCSLKIEAIGAGFGLRVSGNEHEKLVPTHFMPVFLGLPLLFNRCFKVQRCPAQVRAPCPLFPLGGMRRFLNTSPHSPCHRQDNITRAGAIPPLIGLLDRIELRELAAAVLAKLAHEHEDNQSDARQHKWMQWEGSTRNDWGHGAWGMGH